MSDPIFTDPPDPVIDRNFHGNQVRAFLKAVEREVWRARLKFPSADGVMAALTEEVGELAKAMLDEPVENVQDEAVQVAAMACRVALEGDPTLFETRKKRKAGGKPDGQYFGNA